MVGYQATLRPGFKKLPHKKASVTMLSALFEQAPRQDQYVFVTDWGFERVTGQAIHQALQNYVQQNSNLHEAFVALYGDLFHHNAGAYIAAMRGLGYDGVVVAKPPGGGARRRKHLILFNLDAVVMSEI